MPQGSTERSKKLIAKQKQTAATAAGRFEGSFCFKTKIHIWPDMYFSWKTYCKQACAKAKQIDRTLTDKVVVRGRSL